MTGLQHRNSMKRRSEDRILHVHGVPDGKCSWKQPDQYDGIQGSKRSSGRDGIDLNVIEDQEPDAGSWKRWTWTSGSMLPGFSCNTWITGLRMWYPLPLWYVQAEDQDGYQVEVPDNWLKER